MEKAILRLHMLTPLWTGGIDNSADRIHETSIIGSLRWWYEVILRGCGVEACDPSDHICSGCAACQAYGMTGQRRRWRLMFASDEQNPFDGEAILLPSGRIRRSPNRRPQAGGWYIGNGFVGNLKLQAVPLCHPTPHRNIWELPLHLATTWASIGPKTQIGYGVAEVLDENGNIVTPDVVALLQNLPTDNSQANDMPDLRRFFFAKLRFTASGDWWRQVTLINTALTQQVIDPQGTVPLQDVSAELNALANLGCVPVAPAFRNWLRYGRTITIQSGQQRQVSMLRGFTRGQERDAETELFGKLQPNRRRSCLNISFAYCIAPDTWEIRFWGWIPSSNNYNREQVLESLKTLLQGATNWAPLLGNGVSNAFLSVWREFDSQRDTLRRYSTMNDYLYSLLIGGMS